MVASFVGRAAELRLLANAHLGEASASLRDHPGLYFLGKQAPGSRQLREFADEAAAVLGGPLLGAAAFDGWKNTLTAVVDRWSREDGWTDLGECRWGRVRSARQMREDLEAANLYR